MQLHKSKTMIFAALLMLLLLAACGGDDEEVATIEPTQEVSAAAGVIVLSDIDPDDPVGKLEEFQPIADYLAANLGEYGIGTGEVKIAPDLETMASWLASGEVDLFYDSLFPAMIVSDQSGAVPLLRGWRGGEPIYHSVFFTSAESGITSLEDLQGHLLAFDDRASTSGFMVPVSYLLSNGLTPVEKDSVDAPVADDEVGYIFSGDDDNTIEWVLSGRVSAGVVDNLTFADDIPVETQEQLVILGESEDVPRRVLMARSNLDPELVDALKVLFMDLDETEEGQALLDTLKTAQFDEFPEGVDAAFSRIREMFDLIENQE